MTKTQLDNLIQFCFLFHPSFDCDWRKQSPDYLKEKWDKYIGIDVKHDYFDKLYFTNDTSNWLKTWKVSNEDWIELKRVIRFIMSLSEKQMLSAGKYKNIWTLSEVIENFENQIAPLEQIIDVPYNHTHALIKSEIEKWLSDTQNNREYQLSTLIS
jgi:hypothetical protein